MSDNEDDATYEEVPASVSPVRRVGDIAGIPVLLSSVRYSLESPMPRHCAHCGTAIGHEEYKVLGTMAFHLSCIIAARKRKIPANWCHVCNDSVGSDERVYACQYCQAGACIKCFVEFLLHANNTHQDVRCMICKKRIRGINT